MKRPLLISMIFIFMVTLTMAQQTGDVWTGVVDVCGEDALTITKADDTPEDNGTIALDDLLRQFVTFPTEGEEALQDGVPAPSAVLLIDTPDGRYFRSVGADDLENCAPIDPSMPFAIGSNTKMFTANVIYQLQEEGLLSTSDLVSQYLPDEIALWDGAESITIDMLLSHTSGLPDYLNSQSPTSIGQQLVQDPDIVGKAFTPRELIENSAESDPQLLFEPGAEAQWSYSNDGYIMLGQIIEQITGQSYIDAVTERIIDPLGMDHTFVADDIIPADVGLVGQYLIDKDTGVFVGEMSGWNSSQAWSAGSIISTPEDMVIFLRAHYTGELFQDPATLDAVLVPAAPGFNQNAADFYYMHGGFYRGGFLGHGGQTLGTESDVGYNPEQDIVIVTWSNTAYSYTGYGVFHVGHTMGLTRAWSEIYDEIISNIYGDSLQETETEIEIVNLSVEDILDIQVDATAIYQAESESVLEIPEGGTYYITFMENGELAIGADCNTVFGNYSTTDDGAISIELGVSSLVACPEGSIADDFLAVIESATMLTIFDDGELITVLLGTDDQSSVGFSAEK